MLHLAIIGIVCAVSALSEGTAFIGRKNNESIFCHSEGEQNVAKVSLPSYNVVIHNFSDCAKQKISNRTSSFFYDYIIKQYQDSKNSSCSIIKNAFLKKEKKPHSNIEFAFRKRNLLWIHHNSKFSTKTLRPLMEDENFQFKKPMNEKYGSKKCKAEIAANANGELIKLHDKCNLNLEQKKMLLRLKKIKRRPEKEKLFLRHLDKIKVVDELDLNKRIEKLVKQVALENQQKEKYFANDYAFTKSTNSFQKNGVKESFVNSIKKLFCFHNNFFKNKKRDVNNIIKSFPVNKVRGKDPIAKKMALISSSDVSKTKRKNTRFKRNPYSIYNYFNNPVPIHRQYFIDTPYPYSANFLAKRYFLHPPGIRQVLSENERVRPRPQNSLENWPFFKKFYFDKQNIHDSRLKRYDMYTEKLIEPPATNEKGSTTMSSFKDTKEIKKSTVKTYVCNTESTNAGKSSTKENDFGKTTEETVSSPVASFEDLKESTTANLTDLNVTQLGREDVLPDHTLEKPFLQRDFRNEKFEYFKPDPSFEAYESRYYNLMTDFPISDLKRFQPNLKYKYELANSKYLRPRFLKIRHALRNYRFRNNIWSPFERSLSFERKKRCRGKRCSMPRKCWRSAPLLCVPYIKKSQEDVLKYLIKVMQKMIGKPLPLKRDIFERTKFKPFLQKEIFSSCENIPEEEVYECETTPGPQSFYPEYIDLCPPPQPLYYPSPKPSSCASCAPRPSYPPCPSYALTSKLYAGSPYPPYFPYPNSAKVSPELLKSFSYANFNPPQLRQCPGFYSWPPDVPFYASYMGQTEKQNSIHNEGKFGTASSESTSSVSVLTTPAASVTSEANISNSSQIVVSVPVYSNTSNLNDAKTSFLPLASDFTALPSQSLLTTLANPTTTTDFEGVSPTPSTRSACALCVSNSPVEQEEHFSYTAISYNGEPEFATITNQNSETISPISSDQQPIIYNPVNSQRVNCDACFAKIKNTSPNTQQALEWPSTTIPLPTSEAFHYQSRIKETPKNYKELYESSPEYPLEYNQFGKDDKSQKFDSSKSTKEDLEKSLQYDENLQNECPVNGLKNPQKKFFSMKHKKVLKSKVKAQPPEYLPPYDYYEYDKYPIMRPNDNNNMKLGRYPVPQFFWKDFGRTMKTNYNSKSRIRRKREDYYFGSDNFDNYNDYFDDLNYNDEDSNKLSESHANCYSKNYLNSEGTPPSYEMLSELAKAITEFNDTESESTTPMSIAVTVSTFDSTSQLPKSSSGKSSTNGVVILETTKSTPNQTTDKVKNKDKRPISDSNIKSSNLPEDISFFYKDTSKTTFSAETDDMSFSQASLTTAAVDSKSNIKDRIIDSKKFGKTGFFQTNSKIIQTPKNSKKDAGKEEKELENNKNAKTKEEGQIPTTLKAAIIIKGQKKSFAKPSPKVYPKIYPDSFPSDVETNDTILASTVTTVKTLTENRTALFSSTSKPDIKLQLLAVCEGYLEIVKLIKNQNQTTEGDLDADLARYCENIISQSFNNQLEKPKMPELIEFSPQNLNKGGETAESFSEGADKLNSGLQNGYETAKDFSESRLREKIIADILKDPVYTKKTAEKINETKKKSLNNDDDDDDDDDDNDDDDDEDENDTDEDENENDDNNITKKYEEEKTFSELERTDSTEVTEAGTKKEKDNYFLTKGLIKKQRKFRRKKKSKKGLSKEEIKMLKILRKRKKALLSWLFNLKDQDKLDDLDDTEYFDDETLVTETKASKNSGTIKPKRGEKKSGRTKKNLLFDNESEFPIYAKRYGYDKGGELREVEVIWRKINEKTHEEKIFKNLSVLALFMTSPNMNQEDTKFVINNGHENEDKSEVDVKDKSRIGYAAVDLAEYNEKTTVFATVTNSETSQDISSSTPSISTSAKSTGGNLTHTYINKPDSSSIVGECPKVKKAHPNTTRKTSRKMEVAKDIFQEYTIEFVNYAVYILPIMLTIIFLFCCLCCALHIFKTQQSLKSYRKKTKKQFLTPETLTSDTTEESGLRSKKKKREIKFKKRPKTPESDAVSEKIGRRKFWSVLKLSSKPSKKLKRENFQKGKKNSLLRFLKGAKKKRVDESHRTDHPSETGDRRELIALLEEVKKIEMDHMDDKKDLKSVQIQHMTQHDGSVFQRPDVFYPYEKNVFKIPKDYSFCTKPYTREQTDPPTVEDCELYEDVNELTELLPCECTYFSKKSNCLRHCDFNINERNTCKRFLKIFQDAGVCHNIPFNEKNFVRNETENRSFIFNKYRSISMEPSEELMGVTQKNAGTEIRLTDIESPLALSSQKNAGILKEIDNLKRQLISKKNVRLKDDGVLCRL